MNLLAKQKTRHRCREQIYGYQEGKGKWSGLGDWDWHIYSIIYKVEMRTDCIAQETLLNTLCVCVCESLSHVQLFATPWTIAC